jgi:hypothetical protein
MPYLLSSAHTRLMRGFPVPQSALASIPHLNGLTLDAVRAGYSAHIAFSDRLADFFSAW